MLGHRRRRWTNIKPYNGLMFDQRRRRLTNNRPHNGLMLGQRRRRWTNIKTTLVQLFMFAGGGGGASPYLHTAPVNRT